MDRVEFLTQGLSRETDFGIEIGPFYNPIAPKAAGWNTTIVDFTDQADLLRIARTHSVADIRAMADRIEPVDVVWRGTQLDVACRQLRPQGFDFLIASHVIEHLPDLIGFLQQVARLARPEFIISLAVPDCRLTFDFFRPLSNTAHALAAYRQQRTLHAPEVVFEAHAYMAHLGDASVWSKDDNGPVRLAKSLADSHRAYREYLDDEAHGSQRYVDVHCWIFTPSSFELLILELNELGYTEFLVTETGSSAGSEFLARLRRQPHKLSPPSLQELRQALVAATRRELTDAVRYLPEAPLRQATCAAGVRSSAATERSNLV